MERNKKCFCGSSLKQKYCHSDIEAGSMFADLIKFYNELEIRLQQSTNPMECSNGCCECCYQFFEISALEFAYMLYGYLKKHSLDTILSLGENVYQVIKVNNPIILNFLDKQEKANSLLELNHISLDMFYYVYNLRYQCPFLNKIDGSCTVYDYRPFICRKHGIGYVEESELPPIFKPCFKDSSHVSMNDLIYVGDFASNPLILSIFEDDTSGVTIIDQMFPIFYFCHVGFEKLDDYKQKIEMFSKYSRKHYTQNLLSKSNLKKNYSTRK